MAKYIAALEAQESGIDWGGGCVKGREIVLKKRAGYVSPSGIGQNAVEVEMATYIS